MGGRVITAKTMQGKSGNGKKDLHPNSRRVKQAARVDLRTKRVNEVKKDKQRIDTDRINRLLWFVRAMDTSRARLEIPEMHELCTRFLTRLDEELEKEKSERRAGRAMSKRQEELEAAKEREGHEYAKEGLVLPDLTDESSVVSARYWLHSLKGKAGYFDRIRLIRVFKGENELVLEQEGKALGTKAKDAGLDVEETEMLE